MATSRTLAELAVNAIDRLGERVSMVFRDEEILNTTTFDRAKRLQGAFQDLGIDKDTVMCLTMINDPYVHAVFGGAFRSAAIVVPVMFQLTATELNYIYGHTETECIVTDITLVEKVREAIQGLDHVKFLIVSGGKTDESASPPEYALDELLKHDPVEEFVLANPDDTAIMLYTSGTTGKPKGVMLSHECLILGTESGTRAACLDSRNHPMRTISAMPMAHIYGVGVMNGAFCTPAHIAPGFVVQETWFDVVKFFELIDQYKCTDMASVPTMLALMLAHPDIDQYDLTSLDVVTCGAAPVPPEVADAFSARTGCRIKQVYGMTENAGLATVDRINEPYRSGSAGKAYDITDLRIFDDGGNELSVGEAGEIVTKGIGTMKGYFKAPDLTAETIRDGWLYTGDIGYLDEDGWLYVVDRKKDMIIKGGENIFPADVENVIYKHPEVNEAAVIGVPHDMYGEDVVAFVVLAPESNLTEQEIIDFTRETLSKFKSPSQVHFLEALPKSGVGKILRRELRDQVTAKE